MAALGADVTACDVSSESGSDHPRGRRTNRTAQPEVRAPRRDACARSPPRSLDFVVGKAFLHHLSHDEETDLLAAWRPCSGTTAKRGSSSPPSTARGSIASGGWFPSRAGPRASRGRPSGNGRTRTPIPARQLLRSLPGRGTALLLGRAGRPSVEPRALLPLPSEIAIPALLPAVGASRGGAPACVAAPDGGASTADRISVSAPAGLSRPAPPGTGASGPAGTMKPHQEAMS